MKYCLMYLMITFTTISGQTIWEKLNGPVGCVTAALAAKGDTIIVGTGFSKGMIFYSTNAGNSWEKAGIKVPRRFADFVFSKDGTVFAAAYNNGIYKSEDLVNWTNIYNPGLQFWSIGKDSSEIIYAGSDEGEIVSSTDYGSSWVTELTGVGRINNFELTINNILYAGATHDLLKKTVPNWELIPLDSLNYIGVISDDVGNIYAYYNAALQKSTDEGETWIKLDTLGFFINTNNYVFNFIYNNKLIAGLEDETSFFGQGWGIGVSDDGGYTWHWSNVGLPPKFSGTFKFAKSGVNTYAGTNAAGIFKSTNFGDSWFPVNNGIYAATTQDITFDKQGNLYTANWSNGVQRSTDRGNSWEVKNNGLTNSYLYSIIADRNDNLMAGTDQGIFRSIDGGENWTETNSAGNNYCFHLFRDKQNRVYALTYGTGIYRTTDLGNSWTRIDNNFVSGYTFGFAIDDEGTLYAGTWHGYIYKSTDDGSSWQNIYQSSNTSSTLAAISVSTKGSIFATNVYEGVLRSTNNGINWELVKPEPGLQQRYPLSVNRKGEIYTTGTGDKLYRSTDDGDTWGNVTGNLNLVSIKRIIFDDSDKVYLATDESVYREGGITPIQLTGFRAVTDNNKVMLSWSTSTETNNKGFEILRKAQNDNQWKMIGFIGGNGTTTSPQQYSYTDNNVNTGKYYYRLKQIDFNGSYKFSNEIEANVNSALVYSLEQNYPNPFNPATTISFTIEKPGIVLIKIYDILGREVTTLLNEKLSEGRHSINFNAFKLSSGIYFYTLTVGEYKSAKKMQVLK